tara:strand:+ start:780 stop:1211 length:432 start_codon:yes stop_codon:yes gene_type:complete
MSYILTQDQNGSPFSLVTVGGTTSLHCDTLNDADWLSYNSSTKTITSSSTDNYFECSMSFHRSSQGYGIVTLALEPNGINDQSAWGHLFVTGTTNSGAGSFGRGDDTAYSVNNTSKISYKYPNNTSPYTSIPERCKTIVKRLA